MKFGPSGNSEAFYNAGYKKSLEAPKWLKEQGLDALEYSFNKGIRLGEVTARAIAKEAQDNNISISAHGPYYINFASPEEEKFEKGVNYVLTSLNALDWLGGKRLIIHPGTKLKQTREVAQENLIKNFNALAEIIYDNNYQDFLICPETMGKINQMGDLDEIIEICKIADFYVPCIDFGHLHARDFGALNSEDDYRRILDKIYNELGEEKGKNFHIHFSRIQYGKSGEIRHLTFEDNEFGPYFEDLAPVLKEYKFNGWVICESRGTQSDDALSMKNFYNSFD